MSTDLSGRVAALFAKARRVSPSERGAFLRDHCDDPAVREEVVSLLAARDEAPGFFGEMANRVVAPMVSDAGLENGDEGGPDGPNLSGTWIGPYRLVEEIGLGGMGVVYRAERAESEFEQTVAVKLLQRRLHTDDAEQRFRAERQVLARLDHPGVAQLLDGGVTQEGRPYLVMEYVEGRPITEYAEERDLGLESRLDLLVQVLEAVRAAHRQLVVHRDLKPSNVLVTDTENGPQLKLLDFGIAKLLDDSMPVTRPQTRTGQQLMTPTYAAPEQVTGDEITVATDVYQLGMLAYELLAGRRPFDLSEKSRSESERIVLEKDPPPPSERGQSRSAALRGDLDTILMNALRKDPERRYSSVEALRADLRRYRANEPIEARPATMGYRARKFVGRHRWGVGVALAFALLIVGAGTLLVHQRNRAHRSAEQARENAEAARQVSMLLVDLFETADPYGTADTLTARTLLRRGERRLEQLQGQPALRARLLDGIGRAYRGLGEYAMADSLHESALRLRRQVHDAPNPEVAASLFHLGRVQQDRERHATAGSLHAQALSMRRRLYEAPHPEIARSLHHLAIAKRKQEAVEAADSLFRAALAMKRAVYEGPHAAIATTLNDLGLTLNAQDEYAAADSVYREALSIRRQVLGPRHPSTAATLNDLGLTLKDQGKYSAADSIFRKALLIKREALGPEHPATGVTLFNIAALKKETGALAAADSIFQETLSIEREALGPNDLSTARTLGELADVQEERGQFASAEALYREALSIKRQALGSRNPRVASTLYYMAGLHEEQGAFTVADSLYRVAFSIEQKVLGPTHANTVMSLSALASVRRKQGEYEAADSLYRKVVALRKENQGPRSLEMAKTLNNWGLTLKEKGEFTAADSLYRLTLSIKREKMGTEDPDLAITLHNRAYVLKELGRHLASDSLFRRALAMRREAEGERSLEVAQTQAGRGLLARERGRYRKAERLTRAALAIRRAHLREEHPRVQESLRHLAELYEVWDRPNRAREYRRRLADSGGS
jgi:serine/threonine-protein kinase